MKKNKVIMVTSCKGGVGKSTVSANLGVCLAMKGYKTLVIDCDFGVRSLDLIMGLEDEIVFDIVDVVSKGISPEKAFIKSKRNDNLLFCAAPYNYNNDLKPEKFEKKIHDIADEIGLDYVIIDTPGDTGIPFHLAAKAADAALIISTYQPISIRAAERTGDLLEEDGVEDKMLVINCFNPKGREYSSLPSLTEIIDKTMIRLIGVIPYEAELVESQSRGEDVFTLRKSDAATAIDNIASRICGKTVPLFTGFKKIRRTSILKKIQ